MVSFDTDFPADTVEFCPHPEARELFVCGTYKLLEEPQPPETDSVSEQDNDESEPEVASQHRPQKRIGECLVFQMSSSPSKDASFTLRERISRAAITDIKWCQRTQGLNPLLAMAQVDGKIAILEWEKNSNMIVGSEEKNEHAMNIRQEISVASDDVLCLALDWSNRRCPTDTLGDLVASLSNGSLCLLRPTIDRKLELAETWHAHDHEPWAVAWNYWNANIIYSGGDDLKLKGWDIRSGFDQPTFVNKRFDAGVTSIQSHPFIEHLIAVGSYNDTVRLFDVRNPYRPLLETDVGGGAWRVKWHPSPSHSDTLLVACMHGGARVVQFDGLNTDAGVECNLGSVNTIKHFTEHESMAYGADWSWEGCDENEAAESLITTCSFYDHVLHTWTVPNN